jgi:hypothetical protein
LTNGSVFSVNEIAEVAADAADAANANAAAHAKKFICRFSGTPYISG